MGDVQTLVALQANEIGAERRRDRRGERRLSDTCFSLEKERLPQPERDEQRYR